MRTALVTGGASGIGAALVTRLRREGFEVRSLDLATGFDVTDPAHWDDVAAVDVACLNAGVLGGPADPTALTVDGYRRAMGVNVDGVVLGVRRLGSVMPLGGRIVCTASLAGLTAVPDDPVEVGITGLEPLCHCNDPLTDDGAGNPARPPCTRGRPPPACGRALESAALPRRE